MKNFSIFQAVKVVVVAQPKVREGRGEQKGKSQGEFIDYTRSPSLRKVSFEEVAYWCEQKSRAGIIRELASSNILIFSWPIICKSASYSLFMVMVLSIGMVSFCILPLVMLEGEQPPRLS